MKLKELVKKYLRRVKCIATGHRYIIDQFNSKGDLLSHKCLHCEKIYLHMDYSIDD